MILRVFTLLLLSACLASCGSKNGTVPVKLKILQSGITSASISLDGGILIMGKSEDGANSFRLGVASSNTELSLDLVKGRWEFAAVGWLGGAGILSGTNTCAYTGFVDLKDNDSAVTFNFTKARCADTFNGRPFSEYLNSSVSGQFLQFYPVPCYQATSANMNTTNCPTAPSPGSAPTNLLSYKIVYESEQKGQVAGSVAPLVSKCFEVFKAPYPYLPMTSTSTDSPLGFSIQLFTDSACAGIPLTYNFKGGALLNNLPVVNQFTPYSTYYTYFFFNPGPLHDVRVPDSTTSSLTFPSIVSNGNYYVNVLNPTFNALSHPESAREMCLTESTCTNADWTPLVSGGVFNLTAGDGTKIVKLFHRNMNGVVSVNPATFTIHLVTTPMVLSVPIYNSQAGYLNLGWTSVSVNAELVASSRLRICDTSSCGITYFDQNNIPNISTGTIQIMGSALMATMPIGTYYAKLEVMDIFGNSTYLPWTAIVTTYELIKP